MDVVAAWTPCHFRSLRSQSMAWVPAEEELIVRAVARWAAVLAPATFAYIQSDPSYYKHAEGLLAPEASSRKAVGSGCQQLAARQ